jgi:hypothetical protein
LVPTKRKQHKKRVHSKLAIKILRKIKIPTPKREESNALNVATLDI